MVGPNSNGQDGERELLARLLQSVRGAGLQVDALWVTSFYVSLKSSPTAVLVGPPDRGKRTLVRCLAQALSGGRPSGLMHLSGHAWWATRCPNPSLFLKAQDRLNAERILALVEEAWLPRNHGQVFIACLEKISPAELNGFFAEVSFQLQHGELIRLPGVHLPRPIPYPPNLLLLGTLDRPWLEWCDEPLLRTVNLIRCEWRRQLERRGEPGPVGLGVGALRAFLQSSFRSDRPALGRPERDAANERSLPALIEQLTGRLRTHGLEFPGWLLDRASFYLASAWSEAGEGLFASDPQANRAIAFDMALVQVVLPPLVGPLRSSLSLRRAVSRDVEGFPQARALVEHLGDGLTPMSRRPLRSGWEG